MVTDRLYEFKRETKKNKLKEIIRHITVLPVSSYPETFPNIYRKHLTRMHLPNSADISPEPRKYRRIYMIEVDLITQFTLSAKSHA
jgi:hypothetical protein